MSPMKISTKQRNTWSRKAILSLAVSGGCASLGTPAWATNFTWLGTGGNNNWNNALNWVDENGANVIPPSTPPAGDVTNLYFSGTFSSNQTSTQNLGPIDVNQIVFNAHFNAATLGVAGASTGDQFINLGAGGILADVPEVAGAGTIIFTAGTNRKIILTADQTWTNTNTLSILAMRRAVEGNFQITKAGAGTISLEIDNSAFTGGWDIQDGYLRGQNSVNAFGTGPINSVTDNAAGLSASGTGVDQVIAGGMTLGGTGTFAFRGSSAFIVNGTVVLQTDKPVATNQPVTINAAISGPGVFSKGGAGTLTLTAAANSHGGFVIDNGHLLFSSDAQLGAPGAPVGLSGGTLQPSTAIVSSRTIAPDAGGGTVNAGANNITFGAIEGEGHVRKYGSGALTVDRVRTGAVTVAEGRINLAPGATPGEPARVSVVGAVNLAGGTTPTTSLDLANNALIVDYTPDDPPVPGEPFNTLRAQVVNAYNNGAWNQPGITSSLANNSTHGVGYAEATQLFGAFPATYLGQDVDDTAVILRNVRYGDANLDGIVNLADFNRLAANFGSSGATWAQGDFNYDGLVNLSDFNRLAANFGLQAGPDGPTPDDWAALGSAVPEPGAATLLGAAACASLLARRRRVRAQ